VLYYSVHCAVVYTCRAADYETPNAGLHGETQFMAFVVQNPLTHEYNVIWTAGVNGRRRSLFFGYREPRAGESEILLVLEPSLASPGKRRMCLLTRRSQSIGATLYAFVSRLILYYYYYYRSSPFLMDVDRETAPFKWQRQRRYKL